MLTNKSVSKCDLVGICPKLIAALSLSSYHFSSHSYTSLCCFCEEFALYKSLFLCVFIRFFSSFSSNYVFASSVCVLKYPRQQHGSRHNIMHSFIDNIKVRSYVQKLYSKFILKVECLLMRQQGRLNLICETIFHIEREKKRRKTLLCQILM